MRSKEIQRKWPGAFHRQKSEIQLSYKSVNKYIHYLTERKITLAERVFVYHGCIKII